MPFHLTVHYKYLIIVESPSKCQKIESYLGSDYRCIATKGHLREITNLKAIDIKHDFQVKYTIMEEKKDQVAMIKTAIDQLGNNANIILATDDDREGEAIAWHVCDMFGLSVEHTHRVVFHEITKECIRREILERPMGTINMPRVNSQMARQILDMLVGFKVSPFLWKCIATPSAKHRLALSAGRCQTPALRIVYDNYLARKHVMDENAGQLYTQEYRVTALFTAKCLPFTLNCGLPARSDVINFVNNLPEFARDGNMKCITLDDAKPTTESPPMPFNTAKLLQAVANQLSLSPKIAMQCCQTLYQEGYITYMRTDSQTYSAEFVDAIEPFLLSLPFIKISQVVATKDKWLRKRSEIVSLPNGTTTVQQQAHEAIRVTHVDVDTYTTTTSSQPSSTVQRVYKLIWKNTIASCLSAFLGRKRRAWIPAPNDMIFEHIIQTTVFPGWKAFAEKETGSSSTSFANIELYLQTMSSQMLVPSSVTCTHITKSNLPAHLSESSLIQTMTRHGFGRPSTFATIASTIHERKYVAIEDVEGLPVTCTDIIFGLSSSSTSPHSPEYSITSETSREHIIGAEKQKMVIQPLGILVIECLLQSFNDLFIYDYTSRMETELDKVATNELARTDVCSSVLDEIERLSAAANKTTRQSYLLRQETPTTPTGHLQFTMFGPAIVFDDPPDSMAKYNRIRQDIRLDLEKLRRGEYSVEELIQQQRLLVPRLLGEYNGQDVYLKNGKFGVYLELHPREEDTTKTKAKPKAKPTSKAKPKLNTRTWVVNDVDDENDNLQENNDKCTSEWIYNHWDEITLSDAIENVLEKVHVVVDDDTAVGNRNIQNVLRELTPLVSIRKSRYGVYIHYTPPNQSKPEFLKFSKKQFSKGFEHYTHRDILDWIQKTYPHVRID